jgi:hypothetical protein
MDGSICIIANQLVRPHQHSDFVTDPCSSLATDKLDLQQNANVRV